MRAILKVLFSLSVVIATQAVIGAATDPAEDAVGEERAQLARIHEQNDEFNLAVEQYEKAVDEIELVDGQFTERLIEPLTGLGRSYLTLDEYELAEEALKRAQHLTHRNRGVHSLSQAPILEVLTQTFLQRDQPLKADQQQKLALYISERQYGKSSPELVPALYKLGDWYMRTGQFRESRKTYERAMEIIESDGGIHDPRLLKPLQLIAETRRLEGICCSYKDLEEALEIIENNANVTNEMVVSVYLSLGDAYLVSHDEEQAHTFYKRAWDLSDKDADKFSKPRKIAMSEDLDTRSPSFTRYYRIERDVFGQRQLQEMTPEEKRAQENQPPQEFLLPSSDEHYNIRIADAVDRFNDYIEPVTRLVGDPFKFNYQQLRYILPLNKRDLEELADLYMTMTFTVEADGDVENVQIVDSNTPTRLNRLMGRVLRKTQFRPAFADGQPVKTDGVKLTQTFQ
ncbi:MAG: tetratricopeptide repeat protein [Pseudomonadales bacterium]